ncbi:MAG: iron-sulfur cluster assembly protein [Edaphobacter sp.]
MLTESEIITALRDCYDPEMPCNIVDLGLLRSIAITPDVDAPGAGIPGVPPKHLVQIDLILTHPSDDAEAQLRAQIANRLAGLETVSQTTITIHAEPVWSPVNITPSGRKILGLDGNPSLIQIR